MKTFVVVLMVSLSATAAWALDPPPTGADYNRPSNLLDVLRAAQSKLGATIEGKKQLEDLRKNGVIGICSLSLDPLPSPCTHVEFIVRGERAEEITRFRTDSVGRFNFLLPAEKKYRLEPTSARYEVEPIQELSVERGDVLDLHIKPKS